MRSVEQQHQSKRSRELGLSRLELVALTTMLICLLSILYSLYIQKRQSVQTSLAIMNLGSLYQKQVLQYFSARRFLYSLTRPVSRPDFFAAKPPRGRAEQLVGYPGGSSTEKQTNAPRFVAWDRIGFPLNEPSYFIYRVEPEPAFNELARPTEKPGQPYHFHAIAIGDTNGNSRYSVLLRGGYVDEQGFFRGMSQTLVADYME